MKSYFLIRQKVTCFLDERCLTARLVHPLTGVPNRLRDEFWQSLDEDEKRALKEAIKYYTSKQ